MSNAHSTAPLQIQRFTGYGGVTLAAHVGGNPQGDCVVLLHGGGQTRHSWDKTTAALAARGYYAVALDLRGHGDSDWAADRNYTLDAQVNDLLAVIEQLPQSRSTLVGASMGGLISLTVAGEHPDKVGALVLVDVTPRVDAGGRSRILNFMKSHPNGFVSLEEAADTVANYLPHRTRPTASSGLRRNLRRHQDGRWRWHWDPCFLDTFEPDHAIAVARYTAAAQQLRMPTLLVRGGRSSIVTPATAQHFRELTPHAEYEDVADAEHMIAGDRNDAFNEAVLKFLKRHESTIAQAARDE